LEEDFTFPGGLHFFQEDFTFSTIFFVGVLNSDRCTILTFCSILLMLATCVSVYFGQKRQIFKNMLLFLNLISNDGCVYICKYKKDIFYLKIVTIFIVVIIVDTFKYNINIHTKL